MLHGSLGVLPVFYGRDPLVAEELGGLAHGRGAPPIKEEVPRAGGHVRRRGFGRGENGKEEDGQPGGERLIGVLGQVQFYDM